MKDFVKNFDLIDIWRVRNPDKRAYTWRRGPYSNIQSRLDYYLLSDSAQNLVDSTSIIPGIGSDHDTVSIGFKWVDAPKRPSY